jgi:hypothetical protein
MKLKESNMDKNKLIILLVSIALCSCKQIEEEHVHEKIEEQTIRKAENLYANPSLIYGTSFGNFFQSLYRNNQFDLMLAFTSDRTIKQFGRNKLLKFYVHDFKFDYSQGQLSNIYHEGDTINLSYSKACIYGTRRKVVIPCCLERDTIKIILRSLSRNPFE